MKLVTPEGDRLEVTEEQPELLQALRTSFGMLGIVYEVTFRIEPLKPLAFYHESFSLDAFIDRLPELQARNEAMMYYLFPFHDSVTVEFRRYREEGTPTDTRAWTLRNVAQRAVGPGSARLIERVVPKGKLRDVLLDTNLRLFQVLLNRQRSDDSVPADQVIRFPDRSGLGSFTFSLWAFPEDSFPDVLRAYFAFCKRYYTDHGYRTGMPSSGFRVSQDTKALLSYSHAGPVMTIDPVSSGGAGWSQFMDAFNDFGHRNGGIPFFNHTPQLTAEQVEKAYGERLETFRDVRERMDPQNRCLNDYFAKLL
jgi:FAD/FMN-containing dehydrogenase